MLTCSSSRLDSAPKGKGKARPCGDPSASSHHRMNDELSDYEEMMRTEARRRFPAFYRIATDADAAMFDSLVLGHAAYSAALKSTRQMEPGLRRPLEQLTNHIEQLFLNRRDWVSGCATF